MSSELRALIFDVDGTLADTEEFHRRAFNAAFSAADLGWWWNRTTYRELLRDYYRDAAALGGHTPHRLDQAFSFHSRFAASGSMLR